MPPSVRLHAVDGIRAVAELMVVRYHVLFGTSDGEWYPGVDLMSLFFVLSGFSMMYTFEREDFSTWGSVRDFWRKRLAPVYALFLIHWLCWLPFVVRPWLRQERCLSKQACRLLQLAWLDGWAGCGWDVANYPSWYLSCQVWFWVAFPLIKDTLVERLSTRGNTWVKLGALHAVSTGLFLAAWRLPIATLIGFPPIRFWEFVIGCGAALALHKPMPWVMDGGRHWWMLAAIVGVYAASANNHGMTSVCASDGPRGNCSLWEAPLSRVGPIITPCNTWADKMMSKNALVWAAVLHCVARSELDGTGGWPVQALGSLRAVAGMSLNLYLGHVNMHVLIDWAGERLLGIHAGRWRDDTKLFLVYLACYGLHRLMLAAAERWQEPTQDEGERAQETEMLVVVKTEEEEQAAAGC